MMMTVTLAMVRVSRHQTGGLTDPGLSADLQTLLQTQLVLLRGHDGSETSTTVTLIALLKKTP